MQKVPGRTWDRAPGPGAELARPGPWALGPRRLGGRRRTTRVDPPLMAQRATAHARERPEAEAQAPRHRGRGTRAETAQRPERKLLGREAKAHARRQRRHRGRSAHLMAKRAKAHARGKPQAFVQHHLEELQGPRCLVAVCTGTDQGAVG